MKDFTIWPDKLGPWPDDLRELYKDRRWRAGAYKAEGWEEAARLYALTYNREDRDERERHDVIIREGVSEHFYQVAVYLEGGGEAPDRENAGHWRVQFLRGLTLAELRS